MSFWSRPDVLEAISETLDFDKLNQIRTERKGWPESKHWSKKSELIRNLPEIDDLEIDRDSIKTLYGQNHVEIGSREDLVSEKQYHEFENVAVELMPWRKGPFRLFGLEIDSEWRSNLKWDRIEKALGNLTGKSILDVGCGNGYYMYRAAAQNPKMVVGLDPSVPFYLQFELFQKYAQNPVLQFELLGAEHLGVFRKSFNVILCMGILYHQRNPLAILKDLYESLEAGGVCLIESQIIPGDEPVALFPEDRYAKARNVFFVPTTNCLINWIKRAGFEELDVISEDVTTFDEQRKTRWTTFESLEDFLDPNDPSKTVEGYPAPSRAAILARRMK